MSNAITEARGVFPIPCVGKGDKAAIFYVHSQGVIAEVGLRIIEFHVHTSAVVPISGRDDGHFFLLQLEPGGKDVWKIKHIDNQGFPEFKEAGIPDALLPASAERFGIEIWSQPAGRANMGTTLRTQNFRVEARGQSERNELATRMWERIRDRLNKYRVIHDEMNNVYGLVRGAGR